MLVVKWKNSAQERSLLIAAVVRMTVDGPASVRFWSRVRFRSTVARAVRYLRARAPAPACGPRPVVDRALRAGPVPTTTAPPPRHAPECETRRQGRADPPAGRSVGPGVPCARSAAVGRGRRTTTAVVDAAYRAHINTHPRPRATTPFAPTTLFF